MQPNAYYILYTYIYICIYAELNGGRSLSGTHAPAAFRVPATGEE